MAYFPHAAFVQLSKKYEQDNREPPEPINAGLIADP